MKLTQSYRNWRRYRETVVALGLLSNGDLTDIGIDRNQIRSTARALTR